MPSFGDPIGQAPKVSPFSQIGNIPSQLRDLAFPPKDLQCYKSGESSYTVENTPQWYADVFNHTSQPSLKIKRLNAFHTATSGIWTGLEICITLPELENRRTNVCYSNDSYRLFVCKRM